MSTRADDGPVCARCHRPVIRNRDQYLAFEGMHWACFHYEFEHDGGHGDPDVACGDPSCPARAIDPSPTPDWCEETGHGVRVQQLRGIGYWRNDAHPELPDPDDFVDTTWDQRTRQDVADYLGRGLLAHVFMGFSSCRICGKHGNGDLEYTDGTYLWPSGLVHYVRDQCVRLPDEFVRHAQEVVAMNEEASVDWSWWSRPEPRA